MPTIKKASRYHRNNTTCGKKRNNQTRDTLTPTCTSTNGSISYETLAKYKKKFNSDHKNRIIQNAICTNSINSIAQNREYMQSRNIHFTYLLDPKLVVSNQGCSGRCWFFSVLNIMRHDLIRKYNLQYDFEFSGCYLEFYDKLEKCNNVIMKFINSNTIDSHDLAVQRILTNDCDDGGTWITCKNLIKKYGIIPKSCFKESVHSFDTDDMNAIIGYKLKEYISLIVAEPDIQKRYTIKNTIMDNIYKLLCVMLGTPPGPNEKIIWDYAKRVNLLEHMDREQRRIKNKNYFEIFKTKKTMTITPLLFYKKMIVNKLDEYVRFTHDPRNPYNIYYENTSNDSVIEGEKQGYYNLPIEEIVKFVVASIKDNTPVEIDCDVNQYLHSDENLFDLQCFDYDNLFGMEFNTMTKEARLNVLESYPNHAVIIVGCDIDGNGDDAEPVKFKIENSWGRTGSDTIDNIDCDNGYYTMSYEWFKKFVYNVVVHKKYVNRATMCRYNKAIQTPQHLEENDILFS